ncbi:MAG: polymer-forming cytoskeletal protein, partial [Alphaproteobacteria bacterium]
MKRPGERSRGASIPSVLSVGLKIIGNVESPGELHIDGTIEGDVRGGKITLGEEGRVSGTITADTARISGAVDGEIRVSNVTLTKSAKVRGDIHHENLGMEPGALLEGMVRRLGSESKR